MTEQRLPRGARNRNPGNLCHYENIQWKGLVGQDDDNFCIFDTMSNGVRAACLDLIAGFKQSQRTGGRDGEDTVREIITEWAPSNENDTDAYVAAVCKRTGFEPETVLPLTRATIRQLANAIFIHENGGNFVSEAELLVGLHEACNYAGVA